MIQDRLTEGHGEFMMEIGVEGTLIIMHSRRISEISFRWFDDIKCEIIFK
jgi:hypothetical protein